MMNIRMLATGAMISVVAAGCSNPFGRPEDNIVGPSMDRLHQVETMHLEEQSRVAPKTVEQASLEHVDRLARPTSDVSLADVRAASLSNNLDMKVELVNP